MIYQKLNRTILVIAAIVAFNFAIAKESINSAKPPVPPSASGKISAGCSGPTATLNLDINNVRARIMNGGDMWWVAPGGNAVYEIPKGNIPAVSSMFAGAVWVGGIDAAGNLKLCSAHYREGFDYFPGPLDASASTDASVCSDFDKIWNVLSADIEAFKSDYNADGVINEPIPTSISQWPAKGNTNISYIGDRTLADFYDRDNDTKYNPNNGDYPTLKISHCGDKPIVPDQLLWYVMNDKGNIHSSSKGDPIGLEIHVSSFAFATNNEINDMTFYMYKLINKATQELDSTFMGFWSDPDLGYAGDDYVGCDTTRSLGIIYNGQANDAGGSPNYGNQPPIAGIDYFQGPVADLNDGIDNNKDGTIDEPGETIGMSSFMYFINGGGPDLNDPSIAPEYYNILNAHFITGGPLTYGGTGVGGTTVTNFAFPSDPKEGSAPAWSECGEGNAPRDKRMVQTSGPFKLKPGAVNEIIIGVPWVRPALGSYPCPAFKMLQEADDIAQTLFDNCFDLVKGPPAPTVEIRELDQELVLILTNTEPTEKYEGKDPVLALQGRDSTFKFQGYKIFQLKDGSINQADVADISNLQDKAQLLFTVDYKDGVKSITNYKYNPVTKTYDGKVMVNGTDGGILHTFKIEQDAFAKAEKQLINFHTYWFLVVPYAYNNWKQFSIDSPTVGSQLLPYIEGTGAKKSGIPHKTLGQISASYGDDLEVTRAEGQGNGGNMLSLSSATVNEILNSPSNSANNIVYEKGFAPIKAKVVDVLKIPSMNFELDIENWLTFSMRLDSVPLFAPQFGDTIYNTPRTKKAIYYRTADNMDVQQKDSVGTVAVLMVSGSNFAVGETIKFENGTNATISIDGVNMMNAWVLKNISNSSIVTQSQFYISKGVEQVIVDNNKEFLGFSLTLNKVDLPGVNFLENNGAQTSTINYADENKKWLTGVVDIDGGVNYPDQSGSVVNFDWIKSGDGTDDIIIAGNYLDSLEHYESILGATWAPYILTARKQTSNLHGPAFNAIPPSAGFSTMADLASVEIKLTSDNSKWTKCVVVETDFNNPDIPMFNMRGHLSVDKNGNDDGTGIFGYGWFPGYAINMETGERLNIIFGENSLDAANNGNDMMWNPTSTYESTSGISIGGKHYIYILKSRYDEGAGSWYKLASNNGNPTDAEKAAVYKEVIWASMPMVSSGDSLLSIANGIISNDVTIRLRVNKPYQTYYTIGDAMPKYWFGTDVSFDNNQTVKESKLDLINVVPNPYYAYSFYENSSLDNRIKFTNLPPKCVITIYSLDGIMIKQIKRDLSQSTDYNATTYQDWDLKNNVNVSVSSGVYIIHINAYELGEKTLKWFGIMRPLDLTNF